MMTLAVLVLGILIGCWGRGFLLVDSCLDSGGRWNYEWNFCERLVDAN